MNGVIRFLLFVAVVGLIGVGYYASTLKTQVDQLHASQSALTTERDTLKLKADTATKESADNAAKLKDAETKIADLQKQLEEAQKPPAKGRRR